MMNWLKTITLLRLLMLVIQSKGTGYDTEINEIKKITDHDHSDNYITTQGFNKLTAENLASKLTQANLASKNHIAALIKKFIF